MYLGGKGSIREFREVAVQVCTKGSFFSENSGAQKYMPNHYLKLEVLK